MRSRQPLVLLRSLISWGTAFAVCLGTAHAAQKKKPEQPAHQHRAIEIVGEPILKRIAVTLERPRRVAVDQHGNQYVVDSAAGTLTRIDSKGKAVILAKSLNEPSGLCLDKKGNCYLSNHAEGEEKKGTIVRVASTGKQTILAKDLTGPKGLALAANGTLYIALFEDNRIVTLNQRGTVKEFCRDVSTPAALCFDAKGNVLTVNSLTGTVTRISPQGKAEILCRDLKIPSDIAVSPEGDIVVTNYAGNRLTRVHQNGKIDDYLKVPEGTIGLCFGRGGNLLVVNWDLQLMIHVRNRLSIPCPHCHKKIPVRIKPRKQPDQPVKPRKVI